MADEPKDVKLDVAPSTTVNPDAGQGADQPPVTTPAVTPSVDNPPSVDAGQPSTEVFDEFGVPYKNRYMEARRKSEELANSLPNLIEQKLKEVVPQLLQKQTQTPEYTVEQLEDFAIKNPNYRPWAESEKMKLLQQNIEKSFAGRIQEVERTNQERVLRGQSEAYVQKTFPELFVKDQTGNVLGWKMDHPMTAEIGRLMQDPRLSSQPDGLAIASELAHSRYARQQLGKATQQVAQVKQENRVLQKKGLVEGGGTPPPPAKSAFEVAKEKVAKSGKVDDAKVAIDAYFRQSGLHGFTENQ